MPTTYEDYVITEKFNLDLIQLKASCYSLYDLVQENFSENKKDFTAQSTLTTQLFSSYNLFMYPYNGFYELYQEIKTFFEPYKDKDKNYYIQCWLNFYREGDFINWHGHWHENAKSWHGFFCVDCEPSKTTYRIPGVKNDIDVISKNNLLVISRSDGDSHRTWPWPYSDRPRITIAFDILPSEYIEPTQWLNHWVPL
jgi:hypothetical protein